MTTSPSDAARELRARLAAWTAEAARIGHAGVADDAERAAMQQLAAGASVDEAFESGKNAYLEVRAVE